MPPKKISRNKVKRRTSMLLSEEVLAAADVYANEHELSRQALVEHLLRQACGLRSGVKLDPKKAHRKTAPKPEAANASPASVFG